MRIKKKHTHKHRIEKKKHDKRKYINNYGSQLVLIGSKQGRIRIYV
jgi:hypothetical protein